MKFSRQHAADFGKIAVVTDDQWVAWSAWLSNAFVHAAMRVFPDYESANAWVSSE
ncbi:MAG: STAS/SEC14 domain-containing protein [Burkholderiales bacterium]